MKTQKPLETYTLGNSPAAIYLVDVLNNSANPIDRNILKPINKFNCLFKELVKAYQNGHISDTLVHSYIAAKHLELEQYKQQLTNLNYTPLVISLAINLIIGEMTKFQRRNGKANKIKKSAIDRAKNILKTKGSLYNNSSLSTYGKLNNQTEEQLNALVVFNQHGIAEVQFNENDIKEDVTNETLREKSLKRLKRLGKDTSFYKD